MSLHSRIFLNNDEAVFYSNSMLRRIENGLLEPPLDDDRYDDEGNYDVDLYGHDSEE